MTKNRKIFIYSIIVASVILLGFNLTRLDFDERKNNHGPIAGLISNVFLIFAMIIALGNRREE